MFVAEKIQRKIRRLKISAVYPRRMLDRTGEGNCIFYFDYPIGIHVDDIQIPRNVNNTILLVLLNDGGYSLFTQGRKHRVRVGDVVRFEPRKPHGFIGKRYERFACVIMDANRNESTSRLKMELKKYLKDYGIRT